jgi:hypothetical protein
MNRVRSAITENTVVRIAISQKIRLRLNTEMRI